MRAPVLPRDDEAALIDRCRAGDEAAFAEVVDLYGPIVYRVVRRQVDDEGEAAEIVQDVFVSFHRHLGRFRGDSRLTTYLYRVATNAVRMRRRADRRKKRVPRERLIPIDPDGHMRHIPDWTRTPERAALRADLRAALGRAITDLPPAYRRVYVLAEVEGLAHDEAARALGLTRQTVKSRVHRARLRLRADLADYMETPVEAGR